MTIVVRSAELADVRGLARVHVESWRETYRGLFSDEILDDPSFIERRERFWTSALTSDRFRANGRASAAVSDGKIVGAALAWAAVTVTNWVLYHADGASSIIINAVMAGIWVALATAALSLRPNPITERNAHGTPNPA